VTIFDTYRFGRRIALLSGLILAAVDAIVIMKMPQETVTSVMGELSSALPAGLGSMSEDDLGRLVDKLPLYTFIGQWIYCFLYGSLLSGILSRYIFLKMDNQ